ncbi:MULTISPECIES: PAS domain S-box protein [Salinibaculum]|uniref:PAS domain S-box protein n=1 Tax=Salinibaculum TaxID=2732368 RepID=UPI0030D41204
MGEPTRSPTERSAVIAASIDGVGLVEENIFVTANEQLATTFGYDNSDDIVGIPWSELYPQAERRHIESEVLPEVRPEEEWRGEARGVRRDGSPFPQLLSIRRTANGRLVWIVRDQSEQVHHEPNLDRQRRPASKLAGNCEEGSKRGASQTNGSGGPVDHRESQNRTTRFQPFVETAPVPIVVFTANRGIIYCNTKAVELLGAEDQSTILGKEPEQFIHPDQRERARQRIRRVLEEGEPTEPMEYRLLGVDEQERFTEIAAAPVEYEGEPAAYVLINDVTQLRRSENQLRRERQFLETVINAVDDIIYVLDAQGRPHIWNEELTETTGYNHDEIESMHGRDFIPEEQHEHVPGLMKAIASLEDQRVELDVLTKDGESITHEFRGKSFEDPETGEVFRCGVARDITDRLERERRLKQYKTIVETIDDGIYALDEELRFSFVNEGFCEIVGQSREGLIGLPVCDLFDHGSECELADELRQRAVEDDTSTGIVQWTSSTPDGERIFESRYRLHPEPDGEYQGSVGVLRDVTERERRKRTLERNLDELRTLNRVNQILLETTRDLIETADRDVIEQTVCRQLSNSDLYQFAWIGDLAIDGDQFVPRTTAGDDRGFLDAIESEGNVAEGDFAHRAIQTGDVQVLDPNCPESTPWQNVASECGFESVAAVPLHYEDTVYGALMIHTERENAFEDREKEGCDVLGRTIGYIINAVKNRKLLFTDTVRELEFQLADADSVFVDTAETLGCELELDGSVASGQRWVLYFEVDGASVDDVVATVAEDQRVERARDISMTDGEGHVEITVTDSSLIHTITRAGCSLRTATVSPDDMRFIVDAPVNADIREIVDHIQSEHPSVDFIAQRDRDQEVSTVSRPDGVLGELTDRQREVLEAAYRSGYFAWPRKSTGEEVAESLDVTSATLHGHLRKAEGVILSTLFDAA